MERERVSLARHLPELERLSDAGTEFILVTGQAVNFWVDHYSHDEPKLLDYLPFASKDVDLFGSVDDLYMIPKSLRLEPCTDSGCRAPLELLESVPNETFPSDPPMPCAFAPPVQFGDYANPPL